MLKTSEKISTNNRREKPKVDFSILKKALEKLEKGIEQSHCPKRGQRPYVSNALKKWAAHGQK
ncbi:hypothetical protein D2V93_07890 [Flagellimonas taeanensis]|nr:hypothetical protein D2V93_07890 [Allomuricauda taeanensis]